MTQAAPDRASFPTTEGGEEQEALGTTRKGNCHVFRAEVERHKHALVAALSQVGEAALGGLYGLVGAPPQGRLGAADCDQPAGQV